MASGTAHHLASSAEPGLFPVQSQLVTADSSHRSVELSVREVALSLQHVDIVGALNFGRV